MNMNVPYHLMIASLLLAGAVTFVAGCKSTEKISNETSSEAAKVSLPADSLDATLDGMNPEFGVSTDGGGSYVIYAAVGAGGDPTSPTVRALHRITSMTADIFTPDGRHITRLETVEVTASGVANSETQGVSLTAYGKVEWNPHQRVAPGTYAIVALHTDSGRVARRITIESGGAEPATDGSPIVMTVEANSRGTNVEFLVRVERVTPAPDGEYLPGGEQISVELRNDVGETIWNSSTGRGFTQAIGTVEPTEVGRTVEHRVLWDGRSGLSRSRAHPSVYAIIVTIPAEPRPYILREEFTWSGR